MIKFLTLFIFMFHASFLYSNVLKYKFFKKDSYKGSVTVYNFDEKVFFDLKEIAKMFGARVDIYSVSEKIVFSLSGKKLIIAKNSVFYNGVESINFPKTFLIRGSRYFVLSDIFTNNIFTKVFEFRCDVDYSKGTISVYENINVTSVKYFYYVDKSRVVIYMTEKLNYDVNLVGGSLVVTIKNGSYMSAKDYINADDGVIKDISVKQEKSSLKIIINLGQRYYNFEHKIEEDPYKILIDLIAAKDDFPKKIDNNIQSSVTISMPDNIIPVKKEKYIIVIDPGHGGKDPGGKVIFGKPEKQINLEISKKLYELFKNDERFDVKLTRDDDIFIPLYERSKFANDSKCDIFISIHNNSHPRKKNENGFEIYFLSEKTNDPWAVEVANMENASIEYEGGVFDYNSAALVLHSIARNEYINQASILSGYVAKFMEKETPFKNRGIKQAAFYVLRGTYCPSILVEVGFMTNKSDKKNLDNKSVQKKVANAIYKGVIEYIKRQK
ncbi:MAG: N-acetylmuramoyl-L-alanine amidase [Elusimicrobiales bacterium]|nr:N-acetylmuramoyl-L-alanine amidase [Elusimicrobiales bacterium]